MHVPITPPFTIDIPIFTPSVLDDIPIKKKTPFEVQWIGLRKNLTRKP